MMLLLLLIRSSFSNPDLRCKMGKAGREKFEKEFTLEVFEKRMVEILSNNVKC